MTCTQSRPKGSYKSGLLQQVVFKCRFLLVELKRGIVSEQWSLKAMDCLIPVVPDTGLTVQGTRFNPIPHNPRVLRVCSPSLLKTLWEKKKLLVTSNFSFSHSIFYPFKELSCIFIKSIIVVCRLCQFGRV